MNDATSARSATLASWVEGYRKAWLSNEPADIRALFTDDATYSGVPNDEMPWRGADGIVAGWLEHADTSGDTEFEWHQVAVEGDTAVAQARVAYPGGITWDDLWVIRFAPDGRAAEFTEWPIKR
jgi:ketosteroid isomerase-like protein